MLEGVIDHYLQGASEREFDMPLMALLVSRGFYDIHKIHGSYEFGKDFIAKRRDDDAVLQYAIQSKAGDINQRIWREIRPQIEEGRYNGIAHASYDRRLSRRAVLVTTGRLVGAAAADAQEYKNFLNERGEISFDVWDQEDLRYWLIHDPSCGLAGGIAGDLLAVIVAAEQGLICQQQLERYTRQWTSIPLHRAAIEAAVIANKLRDCRRADLAAITALCVLRAARSQDSYPDAGLFLGATRRLHASYAIGLLKTYHDAVARPKSLLDRLNTSFPHIAYPIVCHRLAETWGLLAMADHVDEHVAEEARSAVMTIVSKQPGMERPPSDRWAVSLMCASLAAYPNSPAKVADLLENAIIWTVDYYDGRPGLAPVDCAELEEIEYLMGFPLSHVELRNRRSSYLATMLIDLCAFFGFKKLYEAALNDFYAVNVVPTMISADERLARWGAGEFGISLVNHVRYQRRWNSDAVLASHHRTRPAEDIPAWDALALACLPRNRHPFWAFGEVCRL